MIELFSDLINKKNFVSLNPRWILIFMAVFGDRIYGVKRGSSFLDSAKFLHRVSYKVFNLKGRLIISKNKIIETGVTSKKWNFLAVLSSINNKNLLLYGATATNFRISFLLRLLVPYMSKSKLWESMSKSSGKWWKGDKKCTYLQKIMLHFLKFLPYVSCFASVQCGRLDLMDIPKPMSKCCIWCL